MVVAAVVRNVVALSSCAVAVAGAVTLCFWAGPPTPPQALLWSASAFAALPPPRRRQPPSWTHAGRDAAADGPDGDDDDNKATPAAAAASHAIVEVCLSPGCRADGAQATLVKLRALSATAMGPTMGGTEGGGPTVRGGACCSLCGNGPVVTVTVTTSGSGEGSGSGNCKKFRKVSSNERLLQVLRSASSDANTRDEDEDGNGDGRGRPPSASQRTVLQALDLFDGARMDESKGDHEGAADKYQRGRDVGLSVIVDGADSTPVWLIQAGVAHARCLLRIGHPDKAVLAAQAAVNLASATLSSEGGPPGMDHGNDASMTMPALYEGWEVLQQALEGAASAAAAAAIPGVGGRDGPTPAQDLVRREVQALERLVGWPEESAGRFLSEAQRNRRRSLGFRLQKLKRL
jgi:hypothetical protein